MQSFPKTMHDRMDRTFYAQNGERVGSYLEGNEAIFFEVFRRQKW